ncbi:HEAT repeat domain-containing protein [Methyloglobulus sp.]|uniref:HEAT repeat domain-containing protein n=1 Tax=Methyloglobulus sp. TaxID=2518622 RepID=UPI0032B82D90
MSASQGSVFTLSLVFASLMWPGATHALASEDSVSNALQTNPPSSIQITLSKQADTAIRLEARAAPLAQILKTIAYKTGVNIHYSVLPEAPVTATCVGANVGQVMDCLVAKQVGLVAHKPQKDKPAEFWLLGSSVGSCQAVTVVTSPLPVQVPIQPTEEQPPTPDEQAQYDQAMQAQTDLYLEQLKNAKNSEERLQVLGNLGSGVKSDDPNVRKALEDAMSDKDTNIRKQAIATLVSLDNEGASSVLSNALHDSDASVRMAAVEYAGEDTDLLQQALTDSSVQVRDIAAAKLAQIKKRESR